MYTSSPQNFKLLKGERLHLNLIAEELLKEAESMGLKKFTESFQMIKRYKIAKNDTAVFSFGLFYATKRYYRTTDRQINSDDAASVLLIKLKSFFETFSKHVKPHREASLDIIFLYNVTNPVVGICRIFDDTSQSNM